MPDVPSVPGSPARGDGAPLAVLIRRGGGQADGPGRYPIGSVDSTIGRQVGNTVVIDDPSVAAVHARLRLAGGVWSLADGGSVQGSSVDGEAAVSTMPLAPGSLIRLGDVSLVFDPRDRWEDSSPRSERVMPVFDAELPSHGGVPVRTLLWTAIAAVTLVGFLMAWGG